LLLELLSANEVDTVSPNETGLNCQINRFAAAWEFFSLVISKQTDHCNVPVDVQCLRLWHVLSRKRLDSKTWQVLLLGFFSMAAQAAATLMEQSWPQSEGGNRGIASSDILNDMFSC